MDESDDWSTVLVNDFAPFPDFAFRLSKVDRCIGELLEHRVGTFAFDLPVIVIDCLLNRLVGCQCDLDTAI